MARVRWAHALLQAAALWWVCAAQEDSVAGAGNVTDSNGTLGNLTPGSVADSTPGEGAGNVTTAGAAAGGAAADGQAASASASGGGAIPASLDTSVLGEVSAPGVSIKVRERAGKAVLFSSREGQDDPFKVQLSLESLRELDADSEAVWSGGREKHFVKTFGKQDFVLSPTVDVDAGSAHGAKVAAETVVSTVGSLQVSTLLVTQAGQVGAASAPWDASPGDVLWNLELPSWSFCSPCRDGRDGAFIDVEIALRSGRAKAKMMKDMGDEVHQVFDLGGGVVLEMTNQVTVDGTEQAMPDGYPQLYMKGSVQVFLIRLPRFESSASFSALVRMASSLTVAADPADEEDEPEADGSAFALDTPGATDNATAANISAGGLSLKVLGRSGKFTLVGSRTEDGDQHKVSVLLDALREVDADGAIVGSTGSEKHSIQSFATQDFTVSPPVNVDVGTARATKVSLESQIGTGRVKVDTLVLTQPGVVGPEGDQWNASVGDMKWNIELSSWSWCSPCTDGRTGAFLDLDITMQGTESAVRHAKSGSNETYDLGNGVLIELTNKVTVDGVDTTMPDGFPRMERRGSDQVFVFRFPKFNNSAVYDPLIRMNETGAVGMSQVLASAATGPSTRMWAASALLAALLSGMLIAAGAA